MQAENTVPFIYILWIFGAINLLLFITSLISALQKKRPDLSIWGRWTLITSFGLTVGVFVGEWITNSIDELLGIFVAGTMAGLAQWIMLRKRLDNAGYWILATAIGLAFGVELVNYASDNYVSEHITYLVGVCLGATQILVLGQQYRGAVWWFLASIFGLGSTFWIFLFFNEATLFMLNWMLPLIFGLNVLFYGAITGFVLVWVLKKTSKEEALIET